MQVRLIAMRSLRENYGAHGWDGKGECPQYWKCKGGDEVLVATLDLQEVVAMGKAGISKLMDEAMPYIHGRDEYSELTVEDYVLLYGDEKSPDELMYEEMAKDGYGSNHQMLTLEMFKKWREEANRKVA